MTEEGAVLQQLLSIVKDKGTSTSTLNELLAMAETQLSQLAKAQDVVDRAGPGGWSYHVYEESFRVQGKQTSISAREWDDLLPHHMEAARLDHLSVLAEARDLFGQIKMAIEAELSARTDNKPRRRFWKNAT